MRLVILNGSPAAGKSTVAAKLHQDLPTSLIADLDVWRRFVSGWQKNRVESLNLTYFFAIAAVDAYLRTGNSVIVDKAILSDNSVIDALVEAGERNGAEVCEFILTADVDLIVERANQRRSVLKGPFASSEQVVEFWHVTQKLIADRKSAIKVDTSRLTEDEVYGIVKQCVFCPAAKNALPEHAVHSHPTKVRCVALLPYVSDFGEIRVLLQKRSMSAKLLPGYFGFFGGAIEENEAPEEALKREALEELQLNVRSHTFFSHYEFFGRIVDVFTLEMDPTTVRSINVCEGDYARLISENECELEERLILADKLILRNFFGSQPSHSRSVWLAGHGVKKSWNVDLKSATRRV